MIAAVPTKAPASSSITSAAWVAPSAERMLTAAISVNSTESWSIARRRVKKKQT